MKIGNQEFDLEQEVYICGILNVTPDSFSDGGRYDQLDKACFQAQQMIADGAALIDVGGESTRPGHTQISDAEEIDRVLPVIEALKQRFAVPLSLDTYKSRVAAAGLAAGVDLLNDIWGFRYDPEMAAVAARYQVPCCLMHNRRERDYQDFWPDFLADMKDSIRLARAAGVAAEQIILDPGVGFAKSYEQNLAVINHLDRLKALGYPVLLGTSKKSVIGKTLDLPVTERGEGTLVTTVIGIERGAAILRVHDVRENYRAVQMARAIFHT